MATRIEQSEDKAEMYDAFCHCLVKKLNHQEDASRLSYRQAYLEASTTGKVHSNFPNVSENGLHCVRAWTLPSCSQKMVEKKYVGCLSICDNVTQQAQHKTEQAL